jgi:uncharacterized protein YggE
MEVKLGSKLFLAGLAAGAVLLMACGSTENAVISSNGFEGINVNGQGTVYGSPDAADVLMGVQVPATTIAEAREQAAIAIEAMLKSIKGNGIPDADVRTSEFSVHPRTVYTPGGAPTFEGYQVTNMINVRIRKLENVGKIVDEATAAGGNHSVIRTMSYTILDQAKLQSEARKKAMEEAKSRADELAGMNGRKVGKATQINEGTSAIQPFPYYGAGVPVVTAPRTGGGDPTSIESGQLRVVVNVTVNYELE